MILRGPTVLALTATMMAPFVGSAPLRAQAQQETDMRGRCEYSDQIARYRSETTLILCNAATISRSTSGTTLGFKHGNWGYMAQFSGPMSGERMAVTRLALRDGNFVTATGTCTIFHRDSGDISAIRCLARAGSRSVAANFIPSRL